MQYFRPYFFIFAKYNFHYHATSLTDVDVGLIIEKPAHPPCFQSETSELLPLLTVVSVASYCLVRFSKDLAEFYIKMAFNGEGPHAKKQRVDGDAANNRVSPYLSKYTFNTYQLHMRKMS